MDDTKFSVVIPLYNKEQSIANTLLSVIKQSYQNFEIVVINDGSTDNSVDAIKTINDERIRLINQNNQGVSSARNKGIQEAKYEWIAFLDGDDLWESNHLEEILKMMRVYPDNKVYVTSFNYSDKRKMFKYERNNQIFKIDNYFEEAIKEELIWTSIIVVHKECFNEVGLFNINFNRGEDLDLWARLAKKFTIIKSSDVTAIYRVDAENRTNLSKNLDKCNYYYFSLDVLNNGSEREYYKIFLFNRLLDYFFAGEFRVFLKLIGRYSSVKKVDFLKFASRSIFFIFLKKFKSLIK